MLVSSYLLTSMQFLNEEIVDFVEVLLYAILCAYATFFFYLCRGLQPLDVILDELDSGYIPLFDITEKPSLAYTVRTRYIKSKAFTF